MKRCPPQVEKVRTWVLYEGQDSRAIEKKGSTCAIYMYLMVLAWSISK